VILAFLRRLFTKDIGLKLMALLLALLSWFYIVKELNKGSEEETQFLKQILPTEAIVAKKLVIKPIFIGKPKWGFDIVRDKIITVPEYCIVVGSRDMLGKIKYAFTMPIEINNIDKTLSRSVPLSPIAPGVYMEETLVQVTAPVSKVQGR
jgi:YbbR domain-containing protein